VIRSCAETFPWTGLPDLQLRDIGCQSQAPSEPLRSTTFAPRDWHLSCCLYTRSRERYPCDE